jgi:hypothetical protein
MYARAFSTPKAGNNEAEYEDAFQPVDPIEGVDGDVFRCAVADGATETSYSGIWARLLVGAYVDGRLGTPSFAAEDLSPLRASWHAEIGDKPLPWYAESKARSGAFATLMGLTVTERECGAGAWTAVAVGDSCLIHMRGDQVLARFPLTTASDFGNSPYLIGSVGTANDDLEDRLKNQDEAGTAPWKVIRDLNTADEVTPFVDWIRGLRERSEIRNDDVTLVRVDVW